MTERKTVRWLADEPGKYTKGELYKCRVVEIPRLLKEGKIELLDEKKPKKVKKVERAVAAPDREEADVTPESVTPQASQQGKKKDKK